MIQQRRVQDILNQWETSTLEADASYHRQELKLASKQFCKTVDIVEPWLDREHKERQRIMRFFVLSCHNAAHVLSKQGKHKEAEYYYSHAHFRLLSLIGSYEKPNRLLDGILIELKCTFTQLKCYLIRKDKCALADDVRSESVRIIRQRYSEYVEDVFKA
ncbi:MAG: hypothetical protein ACJAYK_001296 [Crocinitomicaceae bacterium]|jgi:hypothetical protein